MRKFPFNLLEKDQKKAENAGSSWISDLIDKFCGSKTTDNSEAIPANRPSAIGRIAEVPAIRQKKASKKASKKKASKKAKQVGDGLDVLREACRELIARGKTRSEISAESGVNQSSLSRFLNNGRGLSLESIDWLANYLKSNGFIL